MNGMPRQALAGKTDSAEPPRLTPAARRLQRALEAVAALKAADEQMAALIDHIGPHRPVLTRDPFRALVGSILQQQVSMSAAAAMQRKLKAACRGVVRPETLLALDAAALRACGLSRQKAVYMHELARHFQCGGATSRGLRRMSDEEVIANVTQVKGIGRWTAEMLLIFCLERPDVWPIDDLGLRKAVGRFLNKKEMPKPEIMLKTGERFRPYRTYASWYLWRSLEGPFMPGVRL